MSITKKALLTLAAALMTTGLSTATFAAQDDLDPATGLPYGSSVVPICIYVFGGHICF
jgi:hypothetical protein